ncbi:hypothetical protein GVN21_06080 [Caulobacter sp. SLTY]|uniref:hypothetical protein n=1 Tax=Caulobacter sp. SLTY TaxID=2683262 RepID=UPI001412BBC2|nr:hypothetical protein [Caulobacter sp. SLTY]NBB14931.1 hypothetical protein [Caulobacter sp. SLTY]
MSSLLTLVLLLVDQAPAAPINWDYRPPATPPAAAPAKADGEDEDWGIEAFRAAAPAKPAQAEAREAANRAAIARAEQARQDAAGAWPEPAEKTMTCRETPTGLVCGTSEKAMDEQERLTKERLDALERDDP